MAQVKFCPSCGTQMGQIGKYCSECGSNVEKVFNPEKIDTQPAKPISKIKSTSTANWVGFGIGMIVGLTALQSALEMPAQAEYVTFDFTFDHIMNGGWYIWYSGSEALAARYLSGGGMEASTLKMILWFVTGFGLSMTGPAIKSWLKN